MTPELPAWRRMVAGRVSFDFEGGALRYIRVDGEEVLRGIAFLVRDPQWATLPATIDKLVVSEANGRAQLSWRASVDGFGWTARIEADGDGLLFTADGAASRNLNVNRVGFVVLHPVDGFAGEPIDIEHADGRRETVTMPRAIAPHQPATDIAALEHVIGGLRVRVAMTGDAFEMEDQRNWTDASFKTYVRPLARPRPFTLAEGAVVSQSVRLTVSGRAVAGTFAVRQGSGTMPDIALTAEAADLPKLPIALAALRPQWLHLQLDTADPNAVAHAHEAATLGVKVLLDLAAGSSAELAAFAGVPADEVVVCGDAPGLLRAARAAFPGRPVGVGVRGHFTELNRARVEPDAAVLVHATSAIVHAADDRTVLETVDALHDVFASARARSPAAAYRPGPCTIGDPFGPTPNPNGIRIPASRRDPRHTAPFAAAWAVGVLAEAVRGGVASISFGAPSGDFALLAADGAPTPLGRVVREAARFAGQRVTVGSGRIDGEDFHLSANLTAHTTDLGDGRKLGPYGVDCSLA